jgi:hypothetical protein
VSLNRRSLALGAAIALPAGFAAFHAEAGSPPPSAPARRTTADRAIRAASARYWATREADKAMDALPEAPFGTDECDRREAETVRLIGVREEAIRAAAALPAASSEGLRLKAAMLGDALKLAHGLLLEDHHEEWQLAVSVAADAERLLPAEGEQA